MENILFRINQGYYQLRKSEKKVANFFLEETFNIEEMTLQKLEDLIGVAQPTIIRFIKAIGFDSFRQFKYGLLIEQNTQPLMVEETLSEPAHQTIDEWAMYETKQAQKNIASIWKYLTFEKLHQAATLLHEAKTIVIFGSEDSYMMQYEWALRMASLQKRVVYREQASLQKLEAAHMQAGDIACIFEVVAPFDPQVKSLIHSKGAATIVISRQAVDKQADVSLYHPLNHPSIGQLDSSSITLLDILVQGMMHCDYAYYQTLLENQPKPTVM